MKPTYVLQDWAIITDPLSSPYTAPEARACVLTGKVYGNPKFEDATEIVSSPILNKFEDGELKFETHNSIYVVGKKSPNFELFCNGY